MVDSLRTFAQLIGNLPDNTSQLITAQDVREAAIAGLVDFASSSDGDSFTLALTTDTWAPIPSASPSVTLDGALLWTMNASEELVPDWANDYTVAAGLERGASVIARVRCTKNGGGSDLYSFRVTKDGALVAETGSLVIGATTSSVSFSAYSDYIVADEEPWTIEARPDSHGADLDITGWSMDLRGVLL